MYAACLWLMLMVAACGGSRAASHAGAAGASGGSRAALDAGVGFARGSADGAGGTGCLQLSCLDGAKLVYQPDREWQRSATMPSLPTDELAESDYRPLSAPSIALAFSADATRVELTPTAGGDVVVGTRLVQYADRAWYELQLFAGGRFVVQVGTAALQGEYTVYGSGVPIVSSTRGVVLGSTGR